MSVLTTCVYECLRCDERRWCFNGLSEGVRRGRGLSSPSPGLPLPVHWAGRSER